MDFERYFQACKRDTCSCDSGGDCECFCSNVAAYAAACNAAGVCVKWRTPTICRELFRLIHCQEELTVNWGSIGIFVVCLILLCRFCRLSILHLCILLKHLLSRSSAIFCDYYNPSGECAWHYEPCGKPCMKTCKNPSGKCDSRLPALEGTNKRVLSTIVKR